MWRLVEFLSFSHTLSSLPQIGVAQIDVAQIAMVRCLLMGSRGTLWVRWLWLDVGRRGWGGRGSPWVVLAHCGSIGFDGLDGSLWVDWV